MFVCVCVWQRFFGLILRGVRLRHIVTKMRGIHILHGHAVKVKVNAAVEMNMQLAKTLHKCMAYTSRNG